MWIKKETNLNITRSQEYHRFQSHIVYMFGYKDLKSLELVRDPLTQTRMNGFM